MDWCRLSPGGGPRKHQPHWSEDLTQPDQVRVLSQFEIDTKLETLDWSNASIAFYNTGDGVEQVDAFSYAKIFGEGRVKSENGKEIPINTADFYYVKFPDGTTRTVLSEHIFDNEPEAWRALNLRALQRLIPRND